MPFNFTLYPFVILFVVVILRWCEVFIILLMELLVSWVCWWWQCRWAAFNVKYSKWRWTVFKIECWWLPLRFIVVFHCLLVVMMMLTFSCFSNSDESCYGELICFFLRKDSLASKFDCLTWLLVVGVLIYFGFSNCFVLLSLPTCSFKTCGFALCFLGVGSVIDILDICCHFFVYMRNVDHSCGNQRVLQCA